MNNVLICLLSNNVIVFFDYIVIHVLKLNLVRDFQTGIYDYNTMTSVFVRSSNFEPLKVTFSSAEWCGHVFSDLVYRDKIEGFYSSYFEGESGAISIDRRRDAISEDNLYILLRGLREDFLPPGGSKTVQLLSGAYTARVNHSAIEYQKATITRAKDIESVTVPAGTFDVTRYEITIADGREGAFWIEAAYPHRIVRWSLLPDMMGELTGSARLKYWDLHENGDESYLDKIGLTR
jgi:hypothetical protein